MAEPGKNAEREAQPEGKGKCIVCGKDAQHKVYFARAY